MSGGGQTGIAVRRPAWARVLVPLGASAVAVAVWAAMFGLALHLIGSPPGMWLGFVCGVLVGLRVGWVWRRAADLGRGWCGPGR